MYHARRFDLRGEKWGEGIRFLCNELRDLLVSRPGHPKLEPGGWIRSVKE